jgi:hypothetical protein
LLAQPPLCAEHVQQLGSENLLSNLMEVKDLRNARATQRWGSEGSAEQKRESMKKNRM